MRLSIIGCGLIGAKRAAAAGAVQLAAVCDLDLSRAKALAAQYPGCVATAAPAEVIALADIVIVATAHNALCGLAMEAVRAGKHVLIEKPGAIRSADLEELRRESRARSVRVRIGYNLRSHAAMRKARELVDVGAIGAPMLVRGRYGHGGRLGYEKEWRANPMISGGGELIDQGVHLIDLARWFLGPFASVAGEANTLYWPMRVDDNAFLHLKTASGAVAWLHASCTEWKNLFSLEIYGPAGKLHIEGLGGSYGVERLSFYKMLPQMGPPETTIWEYPGADRSWQTEFDAFLQDIAAGRESQPGLEDGIAVLQAVEAIYQNATA